MTDDAGAGEQSTSQPTMDVEQQEQTEHFDPCKIAENREEMKSILKILDVKEYEPEVVDRMIEFSQKYTNLVLEEAKWLCENAQRPTINAEAIDLASFFVEKHSMKKALSRDKRLELAARLNSIELVEPADVDTAVYAASSPAAS